MQSLLNEQTLGQLPQNSNHIASNFFVLFFNIERAYT